jgi:hypothetical protein
MAVKMIQSADPYPKETIYIPGGGGNLKRISGAAKLGYLTFQKKLEATHLYEKQFDKDVSSDDWTGAARRSRRLAILYVRGLSGSQRNTGRARGKASLVGRYRDRPGSVPRGSVSHNKVSQLRPGE